MLSDAKVYVKGYENGFLLSSMGAILKRTSSLQMVPPISLGLAHVLGRSGELIGSRTIEPRQIQLDIHFSTDELDDRSPFKRFDIDELEDFLTRLLVNNYDPFEIEFTDFPGRFYKAVFNDSIIPRFYMVDGVVGYTLICYDPYVYGDPMRYVGLGSQSVGSGNNPGTEPIEPIINIEGLGFTPVLDWGSVGAFSKKVPAGTKITVDSIEGTIRDQLGNNWLPYYSGDLPIYKVGDPITLTVAGCQRFELLYRTKSLY